MRIWTMAALAVAGLALAACGEGSVQVKTDGGASVSTTLGGKEGGYSVNVSEKDGAKTFLVVRPDGLQVAAVVDAQGSRLVEAGDAHAAMSDTLSAMGPPPDEKVAIKVPGMSLNVKGEDGTDERAKVELKVGGQTIQVDAAGPDGGENAVVKIVGVDADAARKFIDEAEGLSADVKTQMKAKLGL
ncbi:MAG: hypothetical protein KJS97_07180 [Alphaproteobacteria bacterium]|nr:hypothetical protein [Alphaproteobacteria bacterium]